MTVTLFDGQTLTVEIGFSTTAGGSTVPWGGASANITWTDVSAYVRTVSISRGRSSELDSYQAGTASIVLSNADRRFDPDYTAGPYYPNVTPVRPVRIKSGSTVMFFGFVDQWQQDYVVPSDATAVISCSDAFKFLNLLTLDSNYASLVRVDGAAAWYRLNEATGSTTISDSVGAYGIGTVTSGTLTSTTGLVPSDTNTALAFNATNGITMPEVYPNTVECLISTTTTTNGTYAIFHSGFDEFTIAFGMVVTAGVGKIQAWIGDGVGIGIAGVFNSNITVNDGQPHHVVVTYRGDGYFGNLWVDGVAGTGVGSAVTVSLDYSEPPLLATPSANYVTGYTFSSKFTGTIDELAFYKTVLTSTQVAAHNTARTLSVESAGNRVARVLQMMGWPTDSRTVDTGGDNMQATTLQGQNALTYLQNIASSDFGRFYIGANGNATFWSRNGLLGSSTYSSSQATFGDGAGEKPYNAYVPQYNDQLVKNYVSVTREGGTAQVAYDSTSIGRYWQRNDSVTGLLVTSDTTAASVAAVRLATYKTPFTRITQVGVNPRADTTLYTQVVGYDIGTRITIKRRPQGVGSAISADYIIEGVAHEITADTWQTTWNVVPASATDFFVLDSSTLGVLDTSRLGY